MQRSQAEAKRAAFLNPEEKEGEKSERDLSRQRLSFEMGSTLSLQGLCKIPLSQLTSFQLSS